MQVCQQTTHLLLLSTCACVWPTWVNVGAQSADSPFLIVSQHTGHTMTKCKLSPQTEGALFLNYCQKNLLR